MKRIIIIGGGIASSYFSNKIVQKGEEFEVIILTKENVTPYDRVYLCELLKEKKIDDIYISLNSKIKVQVNSEVVNIDVKNKQVTTSQKEIFDYDKLIIATGSKPTSFIDTKYSNVSIFRSADDAKKIRNNIENKNIILVGGGPIGIELLETLSSMKYISSITLLLRSNNIYDKNLTQESKDIIVDSFLKNKNIAINFNEKIVDFKVKNNKVIELLTNQNRKYKDVFIIFAIGIKPNIDSFRDILKIDDGILTDQYMRTDNKDIYAIGECAKVNGLIAGHVKECTVQADIAIDNIFGIDNKINTKLILSDSLKVGTFELIDIRSWDNCTDKCEKIIISSKEDKRVDEYFLKEDRLVRFIGINSNIDIRYIKELINSCQKVDIGYLYQNRVVGKRGRLICSCESLYYKDLKDIVLDNGITEFSLLQEFTQAGRVCGKCKFQLQNIIESLKPSIKNITKKNQLQKNIQEIQKRINKYNKLNPYNKISSENYQEALKALDIKEKDINQWVSMVTASMQLNPEFEAMVKQSMYALNKIPIIWLELADCSGNSEALIKSNNPSIEELLFEYISLDYHELLMNNSGNSSENQLNEIISKEKGKYILIVEGAVPLGLDGNFLKIGGTKGTDLLKICAKDAKYVVAVGSCAYDGGVVAAHPNPTNAVGVSEALNRNDIINLPGCPTNPINIVGTLLYFLMFEDVPKLDKNNRPLWAYEGRIHDNCERRGHFELGEFVKQWGDDGAKKGWCLFEMGCKGPYVNANCPTMKFNNYTSWPVQVGHGCMGCVEKKFFDKYANERKIDEKNCN